MFDPANARLKPHLAAGRPLGISWFVLGSPALVEAAIAAGSEAVLIDMQHGLFDRRDLEAAVGLCPPAVPCLVRAEDHSATAIARVLDAGAEGIVVPLVDTPEQAAQVARSCHYPPHGLRSAGGVRPFADFAAYSRGARAAITLGVMIETAIGVGNARAIAETEGVDFVFIGPGDLGLSLGATPETPEVLEAALAEILAACRAAAKPCGIFTFTPEDAVRRRDQGYAVTVTGTDVVIAQAAFARARDVWTGGAAPANP